MKTNKEKPKRLTLREPLKCCGSSIIVLSKGIFTKHTKGKYVCPCGNIHSETLPHF